MLKGLKPNLGQIVWSSEAEQVIADRDLPEIYFMFCFWWVVCEPILTFLDVIIVHYRSDAPVSLFQLHLLEICFISCFCCVVIQCNVDNFGRHHCAKELGCTCFIISTSVQHKIKLLENLSVELALLKLIRFWMLLVGNCRDGMTQNRFELLTIWQIDIAAGSLF